MKKTEKQFKKIDTDISRALLKKRWAGVRRTLATAMAGIVVFTTTYSLILPGLTMEMSTAETDPGIYFDEGAEETFIDENSIVEGDAVIPEETFPEDTYGEESFDARNSEQSGEEQTGQGFEDSLIFDEELESETENPEPVSETGCSARGMDITLRYPQAIVSPEMMAIELDEEYADEHLKGAEEKVQEEWPGLSVDGGMFWSVESAAVPGVEVELSFNPAHYDADGQISYSSEPNFDPENPVVSDGNDQYIYTLDRLNEAYEAGRIAIVDWSDLEWHLYQPDDINMERSEDGVISLSFKTDSLWRGFADFGVISLDSAPEAVTEAETETETGTESIIETETETEIGTENVIEAETETEAGAEAVTEAETETEVETEALTEPDKESETEIDTETEIETERETELALPAAAGDHIVKVPGADYTLHITYGEDAGIPEGAEIKASLVNDAEHEEKALDAVSEEIKEIEEINETRGTDSSSLNLIGLMDVTIYLDGNVIQPQAPITVSVVFDEERPENETIYAVHFPGTGEQPETSAVDAASEESTEENTVEYEEEYVEEYAQEAENMLASSALGTEVILAGLHAASQTADAPGEGTEAEAREAGEGSTAGEGSGEAERYEEGMPEVILTEPEENAAAVTFETTGLSYYAIVSYTVDFHYEVDGKTFDFSIPGGGFVSFAELVEVLGITGDTNNGENDSEIEAESVENAAETAETDEAVENVETAETGEVIANAETLVNTEPVDNAEENDISNETEEKELNADTNTALTLGDVEVSDAARKFVADVENIEFSTPGLVDISKIDNDTTVGELKESRGLEIEYSAELTKEQIAEINAQTAEAGDWALISVQPFTSEETLTVTMKNGDVFTIKVTDAQISTMYLSDSGELFEVTVTYGDDAQIPDDSKLKVTELDEYSQEFQDAWKAITGEEYFSDIAGEVLAEESTEEASEYESQIAGVISTCPAGMKALDISIYNSEGQEIEPKAPVSVSIIMKSFPEDLGTEEISETIAVHHINETSEGKVAETVAFSDGTIGEMTVLEDFLLAEFSVESFSTYAISWGSVTNSTTNLRLRENNNNRAQITVHYVDQDGNAISRPTGINVNTDQSVSWNNNQYIYNISTSNIAKTISGYSYQGAHSGSYDGTDITSVSLQRTYHSYGYTGYYTYSTNVNSIYLVYSGSTPGITVHYGYMNEGTFVELTEDEDGDVPAGTTVPKPSKYGDQWDLEKTIPGYRYVTTRLNNPTNGREISSLLNTDPPYVANTNNTFENANLSNHPSYTSSTAPTSFGSEWRYRQLSSSVWNPTGDHWEYSSTEPVTGLGVTKPVSFAESDKDIYVIYEKGSMSGGSGDGDDTDLGELNAPTADKQVASNHDGTYDVTLSAKGEKRDAESSTKANVVVVLDTSWSMYEKDAGNGQSRLTVAKAAIGSLADKLFALNAEESDTIELAFVNFAQRVRNEEEMRTIYSGTNATSFKNMINSLDCASGTNWDDALYAADHIYFNDNDPTYVVFITDGDPISCAHPYGTYNDWDGGTYYNKRSNYEYALAAKNQADLIIGHNKTLYTIGAFGEISNLQAIGGTYLGQANNTNAINGYFDNIISDIQSALGYQDITINDGITALSSTGLARGDISSLRYYRAGGENSDGSEKYDSTANNGHGEEWEDAPAAYLLEVKSEDGTTKYYKNGTVVSLSSLTNLSEEDYLKKYPVGSRTVVWDINSRSDELLEDGVTYTMIFTMWPSQEAYDLIADLNNKVITYDSLSQAEKDQVYLGDDKVYYLKTNTKATVDYTSVKLVNGEVSGTPTSASAPIEDPKGKMNLDTSVMSVRKEFAHLINEADPYEEIVFYLTVDGKYYNKDGSLSDTLDESTVYAINLPKDGKWEDTIFIAPGLMRGGEILETGHNYSLIEKIVSGNPYEYEFAPQTVRPMVITAVPTFLVKKDSFNTNSEGKKEYTFFDLDDSYVEVNGNSDAAGTYYVASENNGSLTGVNHKTSELDITKIIKDPNNLISDAQEALETFTYRVTLQIPDGSDPSGIVGYEYVPRTQSNAFTLFGYQTGQSAFAEDIARFSGKTYRAWNTLVYDALIEYERVTENGKTVIKAKRDADGNIIWRVPAEGGYHTITYDMTLKQDEVIRFTNLPTGTKYTIQELYANKYPADNAGGKTDGRTPVTDPGNLADEGYEIEQVKHTGGTLSSDKTTVTGTIEGPDTRYYNQFTNKKVKEDKNTRAELKVKKVVEGYTWEKEYYRFTLTPGTAEYSDNAGGTGKSPMPDGIQNSAVSIYETTADHTLSFGTIRYTRPGTYTYTVSEYDNTNNLPYIQFASPVTLTVTVTADANNKLTVSKIEDNKGTTVLSAETNTAVATGLTTQTNTSRKIHISKVDKKNPGTVLSDAVFEIHSGGIKMYLQDGKLLDAAAVEEIIGTSVSAKDAEAAMESKQILSSFTLGEIDIRGFDYNKVYELKEMSPPKGYIILNGSTYFKAVLNNKQIYLRLTDENGNVLVNDKDEPILDNDSVAVSENGLSISVKNEAGAALPNTGGPGTNLIYLFGIMLTAIAGAGLIMRRRRLI